MGVATSRHTVNETTSQDLRLGREPPAKSSRYEHSKLAPENLVVSIRNRVSLAVSLAAREEPNRRVATSIRGN